MDTVDQDQEIVMRAGDYRLEAKRGNSVWIAVGGLVVHISPDPAMEPGVLRVAVYPAGDEFFPPLGCVSINLPVSPTAQALVGQEVPGPPGFLYVKTAEDCVPLEIGGEAGWKRLVSIFHEPDRKGRLYEWLTTHPYHDLVPPADEIVSIDLELSDCPSDALAGGNHTMDIWNDTPLDQIYWGRSWIIVNPAELDDDGRALAWSNSIGWVGRDGGDAEQYNNIDVRDYRLPLGGQWEEM